METPALAAERYGATLNNCIAFYNSAPAGPNYYSSSFNFCCTTPLPSGGLGNITYEPLFVALNVGNLHLQTSSPCINSGYNAYAPGSTDLDGNSRISGGTVDMGAYEFQNPASVISYAWLKSYGLPTDGSTDYADSDGDGMDNWQEWIAGTNPTNVVSLLALKSPTVTVSNATITWSSVTNRTYYVQRDGNLSQPVFSSIQSNIVGQAGTTSFTDTTATNGSSFFYRVGVQ
jgi:hypothetical protein